MPSPFPGMDPYIEGDLWESFHGPLAYELNRQINRKVRPHYYALVTRRVTADGPDEIVISSPGRLPDVSVLREPVATYSSGTAILERPIKMTAPVPRHMEQYTVEVRDAGMRELVTAIEVISPANKRGQGRLEYIKKRDLLLDSAVNLIEMDLLHTGVRVPMEEPYPSAPYFVIVHPFDTRPIADVWPIQANEVLPTIPLPLRKEPKLPTIDLQEAFTLAYDGSSFDLAINYNVAPPVVLPEVERKWAAAVLNVAGFVWSSY